MEILLNKRNNVVDIAKGIAILLVIIGHCVVFNGSVRNIIFSFHMPIFFILSGYTSRIADNISDLKIHTVKNFKHLILPLLAMTIFLPIYHLLISNNFSYVNIFKTIDIIFDRLFYAYSIPHNDKPSIGMLWFVIVLFYSKFIVDIINVFIKNKKVYILYFFISILGIFIGKNIWLYQSLDLSMVAVGFISCGILYKKYENIIFKNRKIIMIVSIIYFSICIYNNIYIELAVRRYVHGVIPFFEAICASYIFYMICQYISKSKYICMTFGYLGKNSFLIYLIHHCDYILSPIWKFNYTFATSLARVATVLFIFFMIKFLYSFIIKGNIYCNIND